MRTKMVLAILGVCGVMMCAGCGSTKSTTRYVHVHEVAFPDGVQIIFQNEETGESSCPLEGVTLEGARIPSWIE